MPKSRPSPARSQGAPVTPRRQKPRTRSVGSPARSNASGRLSTVIDQFKEINKDSFALSPLGKTVLNDETDIEQPRRASWWKRVDNSRVVSEILDTDKEAVNNVFDELDIEVLSQEKKDHTMDLPESSDSESISSIVIPQRRLFSQKENLQQNRYKEIVKTRESLTKQNKTNIADKTATETGPRNLFNKAPKRTKPIFPAALLNFSPDKTANKTKELPAEVKGEARNLFGNRPGTKRKNMFADFILSESEDDISEIQPKLFAFQKNSAPVRHSTARPRESSPTSSITTDIEMDDWHLLPSSTMVEQQIEAVVGTTPGKRTRLSKLSEAKESTVANSTANKTKPSNKSASKNDGNNDLNEIAIEKTNVSLKGKPVDVVTEDHEKQHDNIETSLINSNKSKAINKYVQETPEATQEEKKTDENSKEIQSIQEKSKNNNQEIDKDIIDAEVHKEMEVSEHEEKRNNQAANKSENKIETNQKHVDKNYEYKKKDEEIEASEHVVGERMEDNKQEVDEQEMAQQTIKDHEIEKDKQEMAEQAIENQEIEYHEQEMAEQAIEDQEIEDDEQEMAEQATEDQEIEDDEQEMAEQSIEDQEIEDSEQEMAEQAIEDQEIEDDEQEMAEEAIEDQEFEDDEQEMAEQAIEEQEIEDDEQEMAEQAIEDQEIEDDEQEVDEQEIPEHAADDPETNDNEEEADKQETEISEQEIEDEQVEEEEMVLQMEDEDEVENYDNEIEQELSDNEEQNESQEVQDESQEEKNNSQEIHDQSASNALDVENNEEDEKIESDNEQEIQNESQNIENERQESDDDQVENDDDEQETEEQGGSDEEQDESQEILNKSQEQEMENTSQEIEEDSDEENDADIQNESAEVEEENDEEIQNESQAEINNESQEINEDSQEDIQNESQDVSDGDQEDNDEDDQEGSEQDNQVNNEQDDQGAGEQETEEPQETESETPNVSHDTTGRHRKKDLKSPEAILHEVTNQTNSFTTKARNTSIRKTKSIFKTKHSLAPVTESTRLSDGTKNSSAEGSGWDSHRTTRKTLRQTFGRDFTPRKSLRAMVMEKSAKRQTAINEANAALNLQEAANDLPSEEAQEEMDYDDNIDSVENNEESDHEVSKRTRQTTLEMYLQKIKKENIERKLKIEEQVKNSLKFNPHRRDFLNRIPPKPIRRTAKPLQIAPKKRLKPSVISLEDLPPEFVEDMKYKPPKRYQPSNASWITKRLYKFLESKLEPIYDYKARVRAEKLVEMIYNFARDTRRDRVAAPHAVAELKREMARLHVVQTHFDFYNFFHDYMPLEVKIKVVPDIVNDIPLPRNGVFGDIMDAQ